MARHLRRAFASIASRRMRGYELALYVRFSKPYSSAWGRSATIDGQTDRVHLHISGSLGWMMWLFVHLAFLTGFKSRFKALAGWALSFLGASRTERALTAIPERRNR